MRLSGVRMHFSAELHRLAGTLHAVQQAASLSGAVPVTDAGSEIQQSLTDLASPLPAQVKLEQFANNSFWRI
jgi:hypothetical protein